MCAFTDRFGSLAAVLSLAVSLTLVGCDQQENEYVAPPPPQVTVAWPTEREVTPSSQYIGRLEARAEVEVRARVRGVLLERLFEAGDVVEAGDVLFEIEKDEIRAVVNAADASLQRATVNAELARITLERTQRAFDADAASDLELLQAKAEHEDAKAAILEVEATLEAAQLDLKYATVVAPGSGRVAEPEVDVGNLVGANDVTKLTTVVSDQQMYVYFEATERELIAFIDALDGPREDPRRKQIPVGVYLANGERYPRDGIIDYGALELDRTSGTITIRAIVDNPEGRLVPGMVVRAELYDEPRASMLVPRAAIMRDLAGAFVYTVDASNAVVRTNITPGRTYGAETVVLDGLTIQDRVIVNGVQRAREGLTVNPVAPAAPPGAPAPPDAQSGAQPTAQPGAGG